MKPSDRAILRRQAGYRQGQVQKALARALVARDIRAGLITKGACVVCGNGNAVAHHEDYSKPRDVVWLCLSHHQKRHAEMNGTGDHGVWRRIGAVKGATQAAA